eukprot:85388-Pyramimonas_sp.AAC.1
MSIPPLSLFLRSSYALQLHPTHRCGRRDAGGGRRGEQAVPVGGHVRTLLPHAPQQPQRARVPHLRPGQPQRD